MANDHQSRRNLLSIAAMAFAAHPMELLSSVISTSEKAVSTFGSFEKKGSQSFMSLKQINAGVLNIGYAEEGPLNGTPVILLHGWPYDIHTYTDATEVLAAPVIGLLLPN